MEYKDLSHNTPSCVGGIRTLPRRGIVIHTTMGTDSLSWLQGGSCAAGRTAGADFLITPRADILQLTQPGRFAWHSGQARWNLYQEPDGSISRGFVGIEVEADEENGIHPTDQQIIATAALCKRLMLLWRINFQNICAHYQCALPLGRKRDPLKWDWYIFTREILLPSPEARAIEWPKVLP